MFRQTLWCLFYNLTFSALTKLRSSFSFQGTFQSIASTFLALLYAYPANLAVEICAWHFGVRFALSDYIGFNRFKIPRRFLQARVIHGEKPGAYAVFLQNSLRIFIFNSSSHPHQFSRSFEGRQRIRSHSKQILAPLLEGPKCPQLNLPKNSKIERRRSNLGSISILTCQFRNCRTHWSWEYLIAGFYNTRNYLFHFALSWTLYIHPLPE